MVKGYVFVNHQKPREDLEGRIKEKIEATIDAGDRSYKGSSDYDEKMDKLRIYISGPLVKAIGDPFYRLWDYEQEIEAIREYHGEPHPFGAYVPNADPEVSTFHAQLTLQRETGISFSEIGKADTGIRLLAEQRENETLGRLLDYLSDELPTYVEKLKEGQNEDYRI